jgi:hypothetical protein
MREPITLSETERAALDELLPSERQTGNIADDLTTAAREAWRRRQENTRLGGAVLGALQRDAGSWRAAAWAAGMSVRTARRWSRPPEYGGQPEPIDDIR